MFLANSETIFQVKAVCSLGVGELQSLEEYARIQPVMSLEWLGGIKLPRLPQLHLAKIQKRYYNY